MPPALAADYYSQRAGAGLIVSEATNISPQAIGYALTPGIWSEAQVAAWRAIVDAVHARDGVIFLQVWHTGRISHPDLQSGQPPVAPSAIKPEGQAFTTDGMKDHVTPRALETKEIPGIVEDYQKAAAPAAHCKFSSQSSPWTGARLLLSSQVRRSRSHSLRRDNHGPRCTRDAGRA